MAKRRDYKGCPAPTGDPAEREELHQALCWYYAERRKALCYDLVRRVEGHATPIERTQALLAAYRESLKDAGRPR